MNQNISGSWISLYLMCRISFYMKQKQIKVKHNAMLQKQRLPDVFILFFIFYVFAVQGDRAILALYNLSSNAKLLKTCNHSALLLLFSMGNTPSVLFLFLPLSAGTEGLSRVPAGWYLSSSKYKFAPELQGVPWSNQRMSAGTGDAL